VWTLLILLYPVVALFALAYYLIQTYDPTQFQSLVTRTDSLYFTVITLGTVGYGDVHAVGQLARVVTMIQVAFDLVVIGALIAVASSRFQVVVTRKRIPNNPGNATE
jgi:voltage-gated potassium channel